MVIQIDTRQKEKQKHHQIKEQWLIDNGHIVVHSKCLVGDYVCPSKGSIAIDTKQSCEELYSNLISDHQRFKKECIQAQKCDIKLIVLVENTHGFVAPRDIIKWKNPQYSRYWKDKKKGINRKPPADNVQLVKIMHTMSQKYGVEFMFCSTEEAGQKIVELLGGEDEN